MKKVWRIIFAFCMLTITGKAEISNNFLADEWVDSMYQKLTVAERIGQLIDLRIAPNPENVQALIEIISKYHIGSITITGGNADASVQIINYLRTNLKVPVYVTAERENSLTLPFESTTPVPQPSTFIQAGDNKLLTSTISVLSNIYHELGVDAVFYNPMELLYSETGLDYICKFDKEGASLFRNFSLGYYQNDIVANTDFHFKFSDDFAFSPKLLDTWSGNSWREKVAGINTDWKNINHTQSILTIRSLPDFPENEAAYFNKKIIRPLFWKHLQFGGILSSDFDAIKKNQLTKKDEATIRTLLKIGSDKILISSDAEMAFSALMDGLNQRYFRQNEIREKVKRVLRLKFLAGLSERKCINSDHFEYKLKNPELIKLSYQVYSKAVKTSDDRENLMPFPKLEATNFASLSLGFSELKTFQETLEKYAPFVHYMLPDVAFDPYDLNILSEQLVQFDNVIIGLHTTGLIALDQTLLNFLNHLNDHTNVVIVFLGNAVDAHEFEAFNNKIFVHEDNFFTQQIAAQQVFGALNSGYGIQRLTYSTPEMQEMDSKVLKKIDQIVNEAISRSATPGCQVLVARNGSVIMEKGYGYYTYDSIMPVDTRTIYDLASITKVVATTQAIMKLSEQGKIDLDSTLGAYLPELNGSNKSSLVIKDVLAHQSGLRAFYPFWINTIDDEDHIVYYYNDKPNENYHNTVAYGMFAAEDLKDSLWHWTIETKLRKKRNKYKPYDYKYSDLGFYLLQVLVERITDMPMDVYVDSVFYKPMGMSTLSFNPLCKYPLKRITPTERDTEFRHVLVWGTVHDQIAAMKGGVSGHAGLFSNAHDIAKIMQMQLQDGSYGGRQFLQKETIEKFTAQQFEGNRRGLGWDKPENGDNYNPASRYAAFDSFGHSGFTGTIVWADPTFNLVFVFLSNRIYPNIDNNKLIDFNIRKRINDVVYESMWSFEKQYNN